MNIVRVHEWLNVMLGLDAGRYFTRNAPIEERTLLDWNKE